MPAPAARAHMSVLPELAKDAGLIPTYRATTGEVVTSADDDVVATLRLMGVDIERADDAAAVLADRRRAARQGGLPPVVVAWDGRLGPLDIGVTDAAGRIVLEQGGQVDLRSQNGTLVLAQPLPFGEHALEVGSERATVFSAPTVAWRPAAGDERRWGIFVPTYALRTASTKGIGDLGALAATFDWLDGWGGKVVVTLPMLAAFLDPPAEPSPYSPVSRRLWNELFVDLAAVEPTLAGRLTDPPGPFVDYDTVWAERRPVLQHLADRLEHTPEVRAFREANPIVERYAAFRGAGARHGRDWRGWPSRLPADLDPAEVRFHTVAQWLMDRQLAELRDRVSARGQLLALDLPVGSHPDGFDVWHERDLFVSGASVGAPPDSFFTLGQDWGFPPIDPVRSRAQGHRYVRECIRHHVRHAGLLRIDHMLGFLRQYWVRVDAGAARARHGVYVRYPLEELLAVVCLEAARAGAVVVGENLGTVPPEVTEAMGRHGVLGCSVGQFDVWEAQGSRPVPSPPAASVATLNTHDTATFAAFWTGADIGDRADLGLVTDGEAAAEAERLGWLRTDVLRALAGPAQADAVDPDPAATAARRSEALVGLAGFTARSDAALVVMNVEDGWGEIGPQNVPGTTSERPNWQRRVATALEGWDHDAGLAAMVDAVATARPGWRGPPTTG